MTEYIKRGDILGTTRLLDTDIVRQDKVASWLLDQILYDIEHTPADDAVPVIRCKDCKWYRRDKQKGGFCRKSGAAMWSPGLPIDELKPDDYCSRGERRGRNERKRGSHHDTADRYNQL